MTYENFIKAKLLEFAAREAFHFGGTDAMCAVAQVIYNRVQAGWGDWLQVINTADKFQGTATDPFTVDPKDMSFRRMLVLIDSIYHGLGEDGCGVNIATEQGDKRALYYADLKNLNCPWFRENILRKDAHRYLASVAQLSFFA
jgi:hypothetical protein